MNNSLHYVSLLCFIGICLQSNQLNCIEKDVKRPVNFFTKEFTDEENKSTNQDRSVDAQNIINEAAQKKMNLQRLLHSIRNESIKHQNFDKLDKIQGFVLLVDQAVVETENKRWKTRVVDLFIGGITVLAGLYVLSLLGYGSNIDRLNSTLCDLVSSLNKEKHEF